MIPPDQWHTYDMHTYRTAYSQQHLDMVETFEFDKNYNNFWDPAVLKTYVTDIARSWEESYGFPHTYPVPWDGKTYYTSDETKCFLKCAVLVSRRRL